LGAIAKDPIQHVRAALAESILSICPLIGKKATNDNILQIFLLLLRDEYSEVRVCLFKHLDDITKVIDLESLSQSLFPALNDLAVDKNWRTRSSAIEFLSFFAKKMVAIT
jgi:serine/threonine-protein phosphatase 2A regulatory subunit A